MLDVFHRVDQSAQLFHRHILVGLTVGFVHERRVDNRFQPHFLLGLDPGLKGLALVDGLQRLAGAQVEALEQAVDLIGVAWIDALARRFLVELLQVVNALLDLGLRRVGRLGRVGVDQLVALLQRGRLDVTLLEGLLRGARGAAFCRCELPRPHVAHLQARHHGVRELARGTRQDLLLPHGLLQGVQLRGDEPGAHIVVNSLICSARHRPGVGQIAVALQHAGVGHALDDGVDRLGVEQRAHQLVARGVAEHLRHQIGVQTLLAQHAVLAISQLGPVHGIKRALVVHLLERLDIQLVAGSGLDLLALDGGRATAQELHRAVERGGVDLGRHLVAHLSARGVGLLLQFLQRAAAGVVQPLHVAHAARLKRLQRVLLRFVVEILVRAPLRFRHVSGLGRIEQRRGALHGLLVGDGVRGGEHAVEHAAHFIREFHVQVGQRAVHVDHPCAETLEGAAQVFARGFAFEQIGFEPARELLMVLALLVQRHGAPRGDVWHAEPFQHGVHVVFDRLRRVLARGDIGQYL